MRNKSCEIKALEILYCIWYQEPTRHPVRVLEWIPGC